MVLDIDARQLAALLLGALACAYDIRTRHIPNFLTLGGAALALVYLGVQLGPGAFASSALGWLTGFALFLPFFLLGGMGAGDVKLAACLGAWLGPGPAIWLVLYTAIAGGMLAIVVALATGYLRQAVSNVSGLLLYWRVAGIQPLPELTLDGGRGPRLPYAVPIAAGTVAAIWLPWPY